MKRFLFAFALLGFFTVKASYYGNTEINTYDSTSGNYYKAIEAVEEGKGLLSSSKSTRKITNIAIYDPDKGTHKSPLLVIR